jgi:muconolactone delta-isomerase
MKVLALETEVPNVTERDLRPHLKAEAFRVWELVQLGFIREIYFRVDARAAVLVLECASRQEAEKTLATLPLVSQKLINFEIIPLVPYSGFSRLFSAGE